jgi:hypothetical protein
LIVSKLRILKKLLQRIELAFCEKTINSTKSIQNWKFY